MNELLKSYKMNLNGFHKRCASELSILLYHGVTNSRGFGIENYHNKHISKDNFYNQMKYLSINCNVISIDDFLFMQKNDKPLPERSVIISFDDGFKNNYTQAVPILDEFNLPAVFYITSGIVNTDIMFWVDSIEDCINLCKQKKITIKLETEHDFLMMNDRDKLLALGMIKGYCKGVRSKEKDRVMYDLIHETGIEPSVDHSPNYEKITWDDLKKICFDSKYTIGGHSLYHNILTSLSASELETDIQTSIGLLKLNLGIDIKHYSYPEGQTRHFDDKVISVLKANNIKCSPTAIMGMNKIEADPFKLNRIMVGFMGIPFPFENCTL